MWDAYAKVSYEKETGLLNILQGQRIRYIIFWILPALHMLSCPDLPRP